MAFNFKQLLCVEGCREDGVVVVMMCGGGYLRVCVCVCVTGATHVCVFGNASITRRGS